MRILITLILATLALCAGQGATADVGNTGAQQVTISISVTIPPRATPRQTIEQCAQKYPALQQLAWQCDSPTGQLLQTAHNDHGVTVRVAPI